MGPTEVVWLRCRIIGTAIVSSRESKPLCLAFIARIFLIIVCRIWLLGLSNPILERRG